MLKMNVSNILVFECVLVHITDYGIHSYIMFTIVLVSSGLVNSSLGLIHS